MQSLSRHHSLGCLLGVSMALGLASSAQANTVDILTSAGDIAAFKVGATVEDFEGLTAKSISDYNSTDVTGFTFSSRNAATTPTFDSGGATPSNPAGNPGAPVAILAPSGGIAADKASGNNVAGPLTPTQFPADPPLTFTANSFMEVAMPKDTRAIKVGFFVTHGTVSLNIQDENLGNLTQNPILVPAGSFVAITRTTADIMNVSLIPSVGPFTIDDFTYAFTASNGGGGGGGGGGSTVPDAGGAINLTLAALSLGLVSWKFRARKA